MGAGHVMRCIALAQAWQATRGPVVFASAELPQVLHRRVETEGFALAHIKAEPGSLQDAEATRAIVADKEASWLVIDGYHLDKAFRRRVRTCRVLWVHDSGPVPGQDVDLVVQPGPAASGRKAIRLDPTIRLLKGTRFVLVRQEVASMRNASRARSLSVSRVLLSFGGGDDNGMTSLCLEALARAAPHVQARVMSYGAVSYGAVSYGAVSYGAVSYGASKGERREVEVIHDPPNVAEHMCWADLAISGAGGTCWEQALLGLPALLVAMADNQLPNARTADRLGVAKFVGPCSELTEQAVVDALAPLLQDHEARSEMRRKGQALVDGKGAEHLARAMDAEGIRVRSVRPEDCELLFAWTNDPAVRAQSFSSEAVAWETHHAWFHRLLDDVNSWIFIGETDEGEPIGTVRFSRDGDEATISVSVAKEARGHGYAAPLILRGVREMERKVGLIHAFIKTDNQPSLRAFEAAAFEHIDPTNVHGCPAHHLVWRPSAGGKHVD